MNYDAWRLDSGEPNTVTCPRCNGDDEIGALVCPICDGAGEIEEDEARRLVAERRAELREAFR